MLISYDIVKQLLEKAGISVKGVLHIGAHECEEKGFYNDTLKVSDSQIIWVDGNTTKVVNMRLKGHNNVYQAVLDETEREVEFNITDNSQASSLLTLNHDSGFYKSIHIIDAQKCNTEKLSSFLKRVDKSAVDYNFWNLDIQGSELHVLRGSKELLKNCDAIYTEVNSEHVYIGCGLVGELDELLLEYGFKRAHTEWTDMKWGCLLYTSPSPRDRQKSRMPSSA